MAIEDYLITKGKNFPALWKTGKVSADAQIANLFQNPQSIFTVSHRMLGGTPKHTHDFYEFLYIFRGQVLNATATKMIYMSAGDFCIMNLASRHSLQEIDPDAIVVNICVRPTCFTAGTLHSLYTADNFLSQFLRGVGAEDYLYFPHTFSSNIQLVMAILQATQHNDFINQTRATADVMLLIADLISRHAYSFHGIDENTRKILHYIQAHAATTSLNDVAKQFNYNPTYLSRALKQNIGKSLPTLLTETRMTQAQTLLTTTDESVQNIAQTVGYASYSHFHRRFKAIFKQTPGEYRQKQRNIQQRNL
ncbi:AraC family transcriptional regulator [Loigolactobacillus coryniformis]|uniref:Helix-turn-helix domain-containing protein n=1 Tax=Loigolactobacillus coryniformis TaxID=1610 RepID=A0A5B8TGZ0_9LACO|nr:AraC family transcriptional regulator [Loigolactobacillus coryniformis]MDT3393014.1 AraC family transcriptional regulator [Bacillota bacterium]QEA53192.1 helix-turn-helix domain-containing protein [Loigolactobacillus coryniformis]RRG02928.1 MAG: AraC family transcriptional regulator [Lactobacillus sp.]